MREENAMKKVGKVFAWIFGGIFALFVGTFVIYFFNLDMKAIALIEPLLQKWYDKLPRNQSI